MSRRIGFATLVTLIALLFTAAPVSAEECAEVAQFKHCVPV